MIIFQAIAVSIVGLAIAVALSVWMGVSAINSVVLFFVGAFFQDLVAAPIRSWVIKRKHRK